MPSTHWRAFLLPGHEVTRKVPGSMSSTINRRKLIAFSAAAGATLLPGFRAFAQDSTPAASPVAESVALEEATTISVGAVPVPHGEILQFVQDNLAGDY